MKIRISKLFLYRHRFIIGYSLLGLVFASILILLPALSPGGLSQSEMQSAIDSNNLSINTLFTSEIVNLPYHLLQKASISIFGLSLYSVKLPSIILGFVTGALIILLLNRWFKSNVAIISSAITVLSPLFLFLAGSGTPNILYIFWIVLSLWLGSKIIGDKTQHPIIFCSLILSFALAIYTPQFIYIALLVLLSVIIHPHIRFAIKILKIPQIITGFSIALIVTIPLIVASVIHPETISKLFWSDISSNYIENIAAAFSPFFSFGSAIESVYLSPIFGLATVSLVIIGIIASASKLFTSRNTIISLLTIFTILISGINTSTAVIIFIPIAVLVAAAIEFILERWYSLFPENPYARVIGVLPIATFTSIIVISGFTYTIFGYHYSPAVASKFNNDITIVNQNLPENSTIFIPNNDLEYNFYKILENSTSIKITKDLPSSEISTPVATLGKTEQNLELKLSKIITSPKAQNSDRLYIYNN